MKKLLITLCMLFSVIAVSAQTRDLVSEFLNSYLNKNYNNAVTVIEIEQEPQYRMLPHPANVGDYIENLTDLVLSIEKTFEDDEISKSDIINIKKTVLETQRTILLNGLNDWSIFPGSLQLSRKIRYKWKDEDITGEAVDYLIYKSDDTELYSSALARYVKYYFPYFKNFIEILSEL